MMKRFCFILSVLFCFLTSFGQGLKISEVKETTSGTDAFHAPIDEDGHPCGLVKVLAAFPDLQFDGNVVGDVTPENNEYKVYLAKGSKQLVIKRSGVLPVFVDFPTYGIPEISSKATYTVKLKEVSLNPQKNSLVIDTKPRNAKVYIDDILIDNEHGDGGYHLLLPKGDHLCKVEAKGYRSFASVIKTGKGPQTINAELESLLADIDITCQTSGTHILVDGEEVGVGSWKGQLPAGSYKVEASLDGYLPISQSIELGEKDNRVLNLPSLKRAKGSLSVQTNIKEANVFIDGSLWDNPQKEREIQTGNHKLLVKAPFGYKETEMEIMIKSNSHDSINITLNPINDMYARAFSGDTGAMAQICHERIESSKYSENDSIERNYWFERIYDNLDKIDKQSFDLVCSYVEIEGWSVEDARLYGYFKHNYAKGLKVLQKWIQFDPNNDSVILEMVGILSKLKKYEDVTKWGARGLEITWEGYERAFIKYIAEACIMLGDANRAVTIIKEHIYEDGGWDYAYIAIGDIYKEKGDCKNAVVYYKKYLQAHTSDSYWINDAKERIRDCGY